MNTIAISKNPITTNIINSFCHFNEHLNLIWTYTYAVTTEIKNNDNGVSLGKNIAGKMGYIVPNPIGGTGTFNYYFRIYALSIPNINLKEPSMNDLMDGIKGNIIAYGELIGRY